MYSIIPLCSSQGDFVPFLGVIYALANAHCFVAKNSPFSTAGIGLTHPLDTTVSCLKVGQFLLNSICMYISQN